MEDLRARKNKQKKKKKKKKDGATICGSRTSKNRMNEKNPRIIIFPTYIHTYMYLQSKSISISPLETAVFNLARGGFIMMGM